jgi:hypothetical protein
MYLGVTETNFYLLNGSIEPFSAAVFIFSMTARRPKYRFDLSPAKTYRDIPLYATRRPGKTGRRKKPGRSVRSRKSIRDAKGANDSVVAALCRSPSRLRIN